MMFLKGQLPVWAMELVYKKNTFSRKVVSRETGFGKGLIQKIGVSKGGRIFILLNLPTAQRSKVREVKVIDDMMLTIYCRFLCHEKGVPLDLLVKIDFIVSNSSLGVQLTGSDRLQFFRCL